MSKIKIIVKLKLMSLSDALEQIGLYSNF